MPESSLPSSQGLRIWPLPKQCPFYTSEYSPMNLFEHADSNAMTIRPLIYRPRTFLLGSYVYLGGCVLWSLPPLDEKSLGQRIPDQLVPALDRVPVVDNHNSYLQKLSYPCTVFNKDLVFSISFILKWMEYFTFQYFLTLIQALFHTNKEPKFRYFSAKCTVKTMS
jgi:hypothetical protein